MRLKRPVDGDWRKRLMTNSELNDEQNASSVIDQKIKDLGDWRGNTLDRMRRLIKEADPEVVEELKWMGTPVWSHGGIICTGETYKDKVKLTFAKGAALKDPSRLFNSSLDGNARRAIDIFERGKIDPAAFKKLIQDAIALNLETARKKSAKASAPAKRPATTSTRPRATMDLETDTRKSTQKIANKAAKKTVTKTAAKTTSKTAAKTPAKSPTKKSMATAKPTAAGKRATAKPKLLSGGNPQISKSEGDAPVQKYIAAMPGWKRDVGRRLDAIISRAVPQVQKAVKWNTPFYGIKGQGWMLDFHCFTKYVKVGFFRGGSLRPLPPGVSKDKNVRYLDIYENDKFDEAQFKDWVKQASKLPGWGKV